MTGTKTPLRPDRLRAVEHPFGWLPCRMLTNGTIASMSSMERQLYLVLALAADRHGISFYGDLRLQNILGCTSLALQQARASLIARDLLAYDGSTYQLLALPPDTGAPRSRLPRAAPRQPAVPRTSEADQSLPATASPRPANPQDEPCAMPEHIRAILRTVLGPDVL